MFKKNWRQFGFVSDQANYVAGSNNELYYHCFVKVCEKSSEATCSTTTVINQLKKITIKQDI